MFKFKYAWRKGFRAVTFKIRGYRFTVSVRKTNANMKGDWL